MTMTDEELDREWKPNGRRPQSTIARSFSQELVDIFRIDESVADLDQKVDRRKHTISLRTSELQSLEARLREMEDRLKNVETKPGGSSPPRRAAADGAFDEAPAPLAKDQSKRAPPSDLYSDQARPGSNPVGGDMPPTPGASEDDGDR